MNDLITAFSDTSFLVFFIAGRQSGEHPLKKNIFFNLQCLGKAKKTLQTKLKVRGAIGQRVFQGPNLLHSQYLIA